MTRILIVTANFYQDIADELLKGAAAVCDKSGVDYDDILVPGAFEIPGAIRFAMESKKYDGFIALGCVVRGETTHYDYVCSESARGLMNLAVEHKTAIGYGILTVENMKQARARAKVKQGNKGGDAAIACLHMIELKKLFGARK